MSPYVWRALSWPFAGTIFWWLSGRGVEALRVVRRSVVHPRMNMTETVWATILFCFGVISLVGILTSTPADRDDIQFMALLAGGRLWGILGAVTIWTRFLQRRILKAEASEQLRSKPSPG